MLMPGLQVCLSGCQRFPADITIDRHYYAACTTCSHLKSTVLQTKKRSGIFWVLLSLLFSRFWRVSQCGLFHVSNNESVVCFLENTMQKFGFFCIARLTSSFIAGKKKQNHNICKSSVCLSVCLSVHLPVCYSDGGFWRISLSIVMFLFTYGLFTLIFSLIPRTNKKQQGERAGA